MKNSFDWQFSMPVCGIDEVGRGPLAGPVVAACVFIPDGAKTLPFWGIVTDSKKLSAKKREMLYGDITKHCVYAVSEISPQEIDDLNIHHATLKAMKMSYESMEVTNDHIALIDGKFVPDITCAAHNVVKGDSKSLSIAAASIVAKVHRDRLMQELHKTFPHYGWARNAGYGTAEHMEGIRTHGITPHHRKSFAPCKI